MNGRFSISVMKPNYFQSQDSYDRNADVADQIVKNFIVSVFTGINSK